MNSYGVYGKNSPFTNILSESDLNSIKATQLTSLIKELDSYQHKVMYYGPLSEAQVKTDLNNHHDIPAVLKPLPPPQKFSQLENLEDKVYVVNYDMVQAEIIMLSLKDEFKKENMPVISLFNEYFGGSMSSITFQEMRESKALAYSVFSTYRTPDVSDNRSYVYAYIGTQSDKLPEAMKGMFELMNDLPKSDVTFNTSKNSIIQQIETERITNANILFNYLNAQKLELNEDIRKQIYDNVSNLTFEDIKTFHNQNVKDSKYTIMVLGNRDKLDMETLQKYGKVEFLTLDDIFGYGNSTP